MADRTTSLQILLQAKDETRGALTKSKTNLKSMTSAVTAAGVAYLALSRFARDVGAVLHSVAGEVIQDAANFDSFSRRIGISAQALSELQFAGQVANVQFNQLSIGVQRMTRRIGEIARLGTGEAKPAMAALGLEVENLINLPAEEQLNVILDSLAGVTNASERAALAMKFFDSEGVAMLQLAGRTRELREEAQRLGVSFSGDVIAKMNTARETGVRLSATFKAMKIELVNMFGPAVVSGLNKTIEVFQMLRDRRAENLARSDTGLALLAESENELIRAGEQLIALREKKAAQLERESVLVNTVIAAQDQQKVSIDKLHVSTERQAEGVMRLRDATVEGVTLMANTYEGFFRLMENRGALLSESLIASGEAFGEKMDNELGRTLDFMNTAFANAIVHGQAFEESMRRVFKSFVAFALAELTKLAAKMAALGILKFVTNPLGSLIPGGNVLDSSGILETRAFGGNRTQAPVSGGRGGNVNLNITVTTVFGSHGEGVAAAQALIPLLREAGLGRV